MKRKLGRSGIEVSALGMGCWAIGGPFWRGETPVGWGEVDDDESVATIVSAIENGVTLFDTADVYGAGHSERVLARALAGRRQEVVVATKFGNVFDEDTRVVTGSDASPEYVRRACDASLRRLQTDYIDLYQLHIGDLPLDRVDDLLEILERLVELGKVRAYGWSTDDPERARAFARGEHCTAVQANVNVLQDAPEVLATADELDLACLNRGPLAMGLLTGKFTKDSVLPENDVRGPNAPEWMSLFRDGKPLPELLERLEAIREILTSGGRTLAQGAIAWLWARSSRTLPIPGCRTVAQARENAGALEHGPLSTSGLEEIERLLGRS